MKKCLFTAIGLTLLAGCTSEVFDEPTPNFTDEPAESQQSSYRSSNDALKLALNAISEVSGDGSIIQSRGVADISLYDGPIEITHPTTGAIYVVNFSSGGFALVPAAEDVNEVYGVSDTGSFHVDNSKPNDLGSYIMTLASNYAILHPVDSLRKDPPIDTTDIPREIVKHNGRDCYCTARRVKESSNGYLVKAHWCQKNPYNLECPTYRTINQYGDSVTVNYATGCVPIAMAQIMTYHRHPQTHVDRAGISYTYDWDLITQKDAYEVDEITPAALEVAKFVYSIAKDIITPRFDDPEHGGWGKDYSGGSSWDAPQLFRKFGYDVPGTLQAYDFDVVKDQINKKRPLYISGKTASNAGHAWVIDGYTHRYRELTYTDVETGEVVDIVVTDNEEMVHCNWGWNKENGYYISGIFKFDDGVDYSNHVTMITGIAPLK